MSIVELRKIDELDELMAWREEVIKVVFGQCPSTALLDANREYYRGHVPTGKHKAYVATVDGVEAGCGGVCFTEELPSPDNPDGLCGYLMNIYVREPFRRHGVAHAIVEKLVAEARSHGCMKIYLEATADGAPVYKSLGFKEMEGMMKLKD